ncbi:MAG: ABC transporter permease, partial [Metallibacterium scheffleri]
MKYFSLVWAALWRRKARTLFTLFSVLTAFLLFGMLDAVRTAFNAGDQLAGSGRLIVSSKLSITQALPIALHDAIARVPGVRQVGWANWFGGYYQHPTPFFPQFAVSSNYLSLFRDRYELPPAQARAFADTRDGAVVGAALAKQFGWKLGQRVPLIAGIFPRTDGSNDWNFQIVGIFTTANPKLKGVEQQFLFHWKYFDEGNAYMKNQAGWYVVDLDHAADASRVAQAIDALSSNSDHETRTQTEQAFQA